MYVCKHGDVTISTPRYTLTWTGPALALDKYKQTAGLSLVHSIEGRKGSKAGDQDTKARTKLGVVGKSARQVQTGGDRQERSWQGRRRRQSR